MYSIGQFSLMTRLSVRTLRKYHENGLLIPDYTDEETGYRYYGEQSIERAQVITGLRSLDFSLNLSFLVKPAKQIYFVWRNLMLRACSQQKISSNPQPLMYPSIPDQ